MGSSGSAPEYPTSTTDTGLFGKATTSSSGSTFTPTDFQKNLIGVTENNAIKSLNEYLNPNYDSDEYHASDDYYTSKMQNTLQNDYLNPALSKGLLRGSTASDVARGFANDLANTEYERQQDYRNQQLQNYQAAMLPYTTIYDMSQGTQGLSNSLNNALASYNLNKYNSEKSSSNLGSLLGSISSLGSTGLNIYKSLNSGS